MFPVFDRRVQRNGQTNQLTIVRGEIEGGHHHQGLKPRLQHLCLFFAQRMHRLLFATAEALPSQRLQQHDKFLRQPTSNVSIVFLIVVQLRFNMRQCRQCVEPSQEVSREEWVGG